MPSRQDTPNPAEELPPLLFETDGYEDDLELFGRCAVCGMPQGPRHDYWLEEYGIRPGGH